MNVIDKTDSRDSAAHGECQFLDDFIFRPSVFSHSECWLYWVELFSLGGIQ